MTRSGLVVLLFGLCGMTGPAGAQESSEAPQNFRLLRQVNFDSSSHRLKAQPRAVLDEAVAVLQQELPDARLEVAGHADSSARDDYNLALSRRRAQAVLDYLVAKGIDPDRLSLQGYGETEPVAGNANVAGRARNRRVELRVLREPGPGDFH